MKPLTGWRPQFHCMLVYKPYNITNYRYSIGITFITFIHPSYFQVKGALLISAIGQVLRAPLQRTRARQELGLGFWMVTVDQDLPGG